MKRKTWLITFLVVALVFGMGIIPAGAYFTDTDTAKGGIDVAVEPSTEIHEWVEGERVKHVVISNDSNATSAVFVRVGVFTSVDINKENFGGPGWTGPTGSDWVGPEGLGWFVYDQPLEPGESTTNEFLVELNWRKYIDDHSSVEGDQTNVIVIYESTPVLYDADGKPYADWSLTANKAPEGGN